MLDVVGNSSKSLNEMKLLLKIIFYLTLSCFFFYQLSYGQETKLKIYKDKNYSVKYPNAWEMTNENRVVNIFPKANYGSVTISAYSGIDFPLEKTKDFILDMNEIKDDPNKVKMTRNGDKVEFYYEHIDKNLKWITKAIRKVNEFYLMTINCELPKWDNEKKAFLDVLDSFVHK